MDDALADFCQYALVTDTDGLPVNDLNANIVTCTERASA